jgi:simple sugar transport system substrate-binding protein
MRKLRFLLALLLAFSLIAAACGDDDDDAAADGDEAPAEEEGGEEEATEEGGEEEATEEEASGDDATEEATDEVDLDQGGDLKFYVITHGDGGVFWSVAQKGAEQAGADLGVEVIYQGANNDAATQAQMIEAAIADAPDGIAISLADPEGLSEAAAAVVTAGIPLYTLNSGSNNYKELGAVTHVGQTEIVAGNGAGERFNALGATKILCARQEQTNVALEERCEGLAETFSGEVVSEFVGGDDDPTGQANTIASLLTADPDIDAVMGTGPNVPLRALEAGEAAGRELIVGAFDISTDLIAAIEAGDVAFTVDQQQYLQGYLPVVLMYLQATNLNTAGGGLPILTGPGFVDTENVAQVKALVEAGTR